jgi:hypothetical protein
MDVGVIIAAAVCIELVQIRREFGPQCQQFFTLGLFLPAG